MTITKLVLGIIILAVFCFLLFRNKRPGFLSKLFALEIILGIVAGLYLVVTSVIELL